MVRLPEDDEHRRRWAAIPVAERREVMKAVNRGVALATRQQSILAVGVARKQRRFWSRAWLLGPVVSLLFLSQGLTAFLVNAAMATVVLGGMSFFWHRRASQAERANLAALGLSPDAAVPAAPEPREDAPDRAGTPHTANPPKRPRSKRRR